MQAEGKKQSVDYRPDFLSQYISFYKQLLDEVFVISGIIKVEVGVISRSRRFITLTVNYSGYHKNRI